MPLLRPCKHCGVSTLYISWSALRVHEECKQKGRLMRTQKRNPLSDARMFFPGTVTDRVVRDWLLDHPQDNLGKMPSMVEGIVNREKDAEGNGVVRWKNPGDRQQVIDDCTEAVTKIEPALLKYVVPFDYQVDYRFKVPALLPHPSGGKAPVVLNGAMDILVRNGENWYVWDVKHTRDDGYWRKTRAQLSFYDLAVMLQYGKTTTSVGLLQPLCKQPVLPFQMVQDDRQQLLQRIAGMAWDVWSENFKPREDFKLCNYCDVKHACVKFQPVQDRNGRERVSFGG